MSCSSNVKAPLVVNFVFSIFIPHLLVFAFQSYPSDAELINKHIPHFLGFICCSVAECTLVRVKERRPTRGPVPKNHPAGGAGSSRVRAPSGHPPDATNASDDNDDDFMPSPHPRPPCSPPKPEDQPTWGPTLPQAPPSITSATGVPTTWRFKLLQFSAHQMAVECLDCVCIDCCCVLRDLYVISSLLSYNSCRKRQVPISLCIL
jgi:hypothetical protein